MNARTEDMIDRYLEAVAAQLPVEEREDIIAELRDLILSRVEAKEETLDRALTDDEREAILKAIGHPLVVAARYRAPEGPPLVTMPRDVDAEVAAWAGRRADRRAARAAEQAAVAAAAPPRRWWQRRRS